MPKLVHISESAARDELTAVGPRAGADAGDPQIRQLPVETGTGAKVGIWECTPGSWKVDDKADHETFYVISGRAVLEDDETGTAVTITAGDFVTTPKGWSGRWTIEETLRKAYTTL
jgi:uncharacterized cupin superfamily protein